MLGEWRQRQKSGNSSTVKDLIVGQDNMGANNVAE